jgi:hypothetical protein
MKLRRHRIILALLLVVAVTLGTACRAATLSQPAVECSSLYPGNAKVTFNWTPGTGGVLQYLDLSILDNGFAPGTFLSAGPLDGNTNSFAWDGLLPSTTHYFRVNTLSASGWQPSATGYVTTGVCAAPPPQPGGGTCIESRIDGDFEGWDGDTLFALSNGQFWQQASMSLLLHLALSPRVTICPVAGGYEMWVEGVDKSIYVTPLTCMKTCIEGSFEGWDGDTVFNLCNGQTWQQASYSYTYHYAYRPDAFICAVGGGYKMWVEGIDKSVYVVRLR